jgi:FlaA1/EpsC-like NDP-sugar epimerase
MSMRVVSRGRIHLGDYGELCVLDMGAPIEVDERAHLMIARSGRFDGVDVRSSPRGSAGEKLSEERLTEEEAQSRAVRTGSPSRIRPHRAIWPLRLAGLSVLAEAGDRDALVAAMKDLVPSSCPPRRARGTRRTGRSDSE